MEVENFKGIKFRNLAQDRNGSVYGASTKGIYNLLDWSKVFIANTDIDEDIQITQIYFDAQNHLWLLTNRGLYVKKGNHYANILPLDKINSHFTSIVQDSRSRIWVGTTKGAYLIQKDKPIEYIGSKSGLSDNTINYIFLDRENNLWFATDADGIFKLSPTALESLDYTSGLPGRVVMGMATDVKGNTWVGTTDGGLSMYSNGEFKGVQLPSKSAEAQKINALLYDSRSRLWIGTLGGGLWIMENNKVKQIMTSKGNYLSSIISISELADKTIWVTTPSGLYYHVNGFLQKLMGLENPCFSVMEKSKDTLLVGSTDGLFEIVGKSKISKIELKNHGVYGKFPFKPLFGIRF